MALILVGGGARSGKSSHALLLARARGSKLAMIATAEAQDGEMRDRIEMHRRDRGCEFTTFEAPIDVAATVIEAAASYDAIVLDCVTLWLSNLLLKGEEDLRLRTRHLAEVARDAAATVIAVTNEVGCGIVPENELARRFRDVAGWANQDLAREAAEVYWMVFGCPLRVK